MKYDKVVEIRGQTDISEVRGVAFYLANEKCVYEILVQP